MNTKQVMINIGCGPLGHEDWINIDYGILAFLHKYTWIEKILFKLNLWPKGYDLRWPKNLLFRNCKKGLPFDNNSVDFIYCSHFLEHLKKFETERLLKCCYKCLKHGGIIRLVLPDLDIVVKQYINNINNIEKVDTINNHFFLEHHKNESTKLLGRLSTLFMRGHKWMYNFEYLKTMLEDVGFKSEAIIRYQFQKGTVPNLDTLDSHKDHSFYLEATK